MFSKSAAYYDEIYASIGKDYARESSKAHRLIQKYSSAGGRTLLDVACGTGHHAGFFGENYQVTGLDLDPGMLSIARNKYPKIRFYMGNMMNFKLKKRFDAIVCLFSSIGYVKTRSNLQKALSCMDRHLAPGGVILIEPWFSPKQWHVGRVFTTQVNIPDLKIVRMSRSTLRGKISVIEFQYLIGTPQGIEHSVEHHELGLFTHTEYVRALRSVGLKVIHDAEGLDGRGLYIGIKS